MIQLDGHEAYRLMTLAASGYEKHVEEAEGAIRLALDPEVSMVGPGIIGATISIMEEEIKALNKLHDWLLANGFCSPYTEPPSVEAFKQRMDSIQKEIE